MSAAATAAGYLYASGRLRGRAAREQEENEQRPPQKEQRPGKPRKAIRVAVMPTREVVPTREEPTPAAPEKTPKIEYRTRRRWSAE